MLSAIAAEAVFSRKEKWLKKRQRKKGEAEGMGLQNIKSCFIVSLCWAQDWVDGADENKHALVVFVECTVVHGHFTSKRRRRRRMEGDGSYR